MKIVVAAAGLLLFQLAFSTVGSASAFIVVTPDATTTTTTPIRCWRRFLPPLGMSKNNNNNNNEQQWNDADGPATTKPRAPIKSQALPFMNKPATLDGSYAGDCGFDPLGFANNQERLTEFREAEIKHARLAMLAAAGWPLSELWDKKIASLLDLPPILLDDATGNRAPSVLNGGLGKISPAYWFGCLAFAGAMEAYSGVVASKKEGYFPGNLQFDPLGLYPNDKNLQKQMQLSEIKHGRLAMIAITAFAAQEFVAETAVIDHASIFFKPITQVLAENEQFFPGLYAAGPMDEIVQVPPVLDAVSSAATFVPPPVDALSSSAAASTAVDVITNTATSSSPVPTVVVEAATAPSSAELLAAKERIIELEAKLSKIAELSR
mmetsp:Transcript_49183/g.54787  ORF Transcript_49183/g.54787 Transcript_49183/m.54787 type:complete len:379 (-) Transcript_49183:27-1163(-)